MKKVLGWILAAILLFGFIYVLSCVYGLERTLITIVISLVLTGLILLSFYLIMD